MLTQSRLSWLVIIIIVTITIGGFFPSPLTAAKLQPSAAAGFTRYGNYEERKYRKLRQWRLFMD